MRRALAVLASTLLWAAALELSAQTACPPCSPTNNFTSAAVNLAVGSCCQMTVTFPPGVDGYWGTAAPCATQCLGDTCYDLRLAYVEANPPGDCSGTPDLFRFSNSMAWDAVRGQLRFDAHAHHSVRKKHLVYTVATNTWSLATPAPSGAHHGYEWETADQHGNSYVNEWELNVADGVSDRTYQWDGSAWSVWNCAPDAVCTGPNRYAFGGGNTNTPGLEWFPDRNEMIRTEPNLAKALPTTGTPDPVPSAPWVLIPINGTGYISPYYVDRETGSGAIVLIGGNLAVTRYNADGTTAPLGASPCAGDTNTSGANIAADHIGGKLIMNCSDTGTWYAYNPWASGAPWYTTITGPPDFSGTGAAEVWNSAITEGIAEHNVIVFVNSRRGTQLGGLFLYKHTQANADWTARSTAAGVTMATNFAVSADVFDFIRDAPASYVHETSIKLSGGGSLKILLPDSDAGAGHDWWRFLDDAMIPFGSDEPSGSPAYTLRGEYWLSYAVYMPTDYYNWIYDMTGGGKKFSITSSHPVDSVNPVTRAAITFPTDPPTGTQRTGSSVNNELVITDTRQTMNTQFYINNINGSASWQNDWASNNPCSGSDRRWLSVDAGVKTNTPLAWAGDQRSQACRNWNAQFGPSFWYENSPGHAYPVKSSTAGIRTSQAQPWPDPIAAGKTWRAGWNTILYHVIFPSTWTTSDGTLEAWMWHPGETGWTKLFEKFDVVFKTPAAIANGITLNNGVDGYFHWGLWLTPFRTGGVAEIGIRPNTFIIYDEVIVSTQAIAAPTYGATGPGAVCGNLAVEPGEECEASLTPTCCDAGTCQFNSSSTPCASDSDACTADLCSGSGTTCLHTLTCMRASGVSMLGVNAK